MTSVPPQAAVLVVGTRKSALAQRQTARVVALLREAWPGLECDVRQIDTRGDRTQRTGEPLPEIGGKGLFTAELEQDLREGRLDVAVHSLKDLPTEDPTDVTIGAVCRREDVRDCLVSRNGTRLHELPAGAVVGTSSLRRSAQLRASRPDLQVRSIRGNVDTRIRKVHEGDFDAALLAAAGIARLGLEGEVAEWLPLETMLPAPGQGALAVQCRAGDEQVLELLAAIDDPVTRAATTAERSFLRALGAGCTAPVAAYADAVGREPSPPSDKVSQAASAAPVQLRGLVLSRDGREVIRVEGEGAPDEIGSELAREALARGADAILEHVRLPLRGRRIVVTRPEDQARKLARRLEELGAAVSALPLVRIEPVDPAALETAARDVASHDWVVFTSANAVAALRLANADLTSPHVAAVGPATAAAVRELGVEPAFVPARFAAEEIVAGLGPLSGARVLLPQADLADSTVADALRSRGATVTSVTVYRTVAVERTAAELAELRTSDAVLVASSSAVRSLAEQGGAGEALLVYIGPKTAAVAREAGLPEGIVADEATSEGIIHALTSHFEEQGDS